ncbi:MAG: TOBE domain-containing protein, partial [Caldilinea sp.]
YCPPNELYDRPPTLFIAGFVGNPPMNFIEVEVVQRDSIYHAQRAGFDLPLLVERGRQAAGRGPVILGIRPEDVTIAEDGIAGEIYVVEPLGRDDLIDVRIGDVHVHVLADPTLNLRLGDRVALRFNTQKIQLFDLKTEQSLLWT